MIKLNFKGSYTVGTLISGRRGTLIQRRIAHNNMAALDSVWLENIEVFNEKQAEAFLLPDEEFGH